MTLRFFYECKNGQDNFRSCNLFNIGKHFFWQEVYLLKSLHVNEAFSFIFRKESFGADKKESLNDFSLIYLFCYFTMS